MRALGRLRRRLAGEGGRPSFARDERGSAMFEFAFLSPIFLMLLLSFYDMGMYMLRQVMISSSVDRAVQDLRIAGTVNDDGSPTTTADFVRVVCQRAMVLNSCNQTLVVDMSVIPPGQPFPNRSGPCIQRSNDPNQPDMRPATTFDQGQTADIVFIRVCGTSVPMTPGMGFAKIFTNADGDIIVRASTAFTNE